MDDFNTIRFKRKTIKRFKIFSKQIATTYSETLEVMLDFFEKNGVSPDESIGPHMQTLESKIKKRINAMIAIIKDIEKHQTKPTNAMMQLLFKESPKEEKQLLLEHKVQVGQSESKFNPNTALENYQNHHQKSNIQIGELINDFENILKKTTYVKSNFGTDHYRFNISKVAFENLKDKLSNVHHHHSTETNR